VIPQTTQQLFEIVVQLEHRLFPRHTHIRRRTGSTSFIPGLGDHHPRICPYSFDFNSLDPSILGLHSKMTDFMDNSRREFAQNYQSSSPLSTSHTVSTTATSGGPVTPLDLYSLRQNQTLFDSNFDLSPASEPLTKEQYNGFADDYFLNELVRQEPLNSKRNSDGVQNGQTLFDSSNIYNPNQYQPPSDGNWSVSPSVATSPPVRKLHDYSSRKSSVQTSNLSYTSSSTPATQFDRFLALTPLTTPGDQLPYQQSSQDFPFYSNSNSTSKNMSPTQSPLDSMQEELNYQDMTAAQDFTDTATTKRTRAEGRSDAISACWTSPLCPNHTDPRDGTPPNPATCGGGCAPFLFGEEPLPDGINDATLDMAVVSVDQLSINSRSQSQQQNQQQEKPKAQRVPKRTDTSSKHENQGRPLPKTAADMKQSSSPEATIIDSIENTKKNSRQPHNKVEQKYRDSINNQMEALRKVIPSLSESARACSDGADIEDLPVPSKPSKAVILASATAFIKAQTKEKRQLEAENLLLRQRVQALQALVKCDDCSLMQYVVDLNLRNGTNTDPLSMR
jgi:hypothetical protein